jgi:hypothetical protein
MASIYENGLFTIAATWSKDSNGGLYSKCASIHQPQRLTACGLYARLRQPLLFHEANHSISNNGEMPLLSRGWVFQERLLSPRVIHFTKNQLFFECNRVILSECGSQDWRMKKHGKLRQYQLRSSPIKFRPKDTSLSWQLIIAQYTSLQLTRHTDILPALAGIVEREMALRPNDAYIAGMWKSTLLDDLAFHGNGHRTSGKYPTWSWVFLDGAIRFRSYERSSTLELVNIAFKRVGPVSIGEVSEASITLRGNVWEVKVHERVEDRAFEFGETLSMVYALHTTRRSNAIGWGDIELELDCFAPVQIGLGTPLTVLVLSSAGYHAVGIALQKVSAKQHVKVGTVTIYTVSDLRMEIDVEDMTKVVEDYLVGLPVQEVEII